MPRHRSKAHDPPPPPPPAGQSIQLPTPWSSWAWSDEYRDHYRCRQVAATGVAEKDYQYEHQKGDHIPRSDPAMSVANITELREPSKESTKEPNYTLDSPTANVTDSFNRNALPVTSRTKPLVSQLTTAPLQSKIRSTGFDADQSNHNDGHGGDVSDRHVRINDISAAVDGLNSGFQVQPSYEFRFGKVFKVLWSEPTTRTGTEITRCRQAGYGENAYDSIRRFVVVDDRNRGHSLCLPILTYGGRGTLKKGVYAETHAVIYTGEVAPLMPGEKMTKKPVQMNPNNQRHKLDAASRINYAKVYTVEHNIKVQFIGRIARIHEQQVITDYNNTHGPLPDRPAPGGRDDDVFKHLKGANPNYPSQSNQPAVGAYQQASHSALTSTTTGPSSKIVATSNRSIASMQPQSPQIPQIPQYTTTSSPSSSHSVPNSQIPLSAAGQHPRPSDATSTRPPGSKHGKREGANQVYNSTPLYDE